MKGCTRNGLPPGLTWATANSALRKGSTRVPSLEVPSGKSMRLSPVFSRLESGDSLILFPEGTSSDGTRVLPFRSALFAVAQVKPGGKPLRVQPFTVAYTRLDGIPLGRYWRPYFTWYGDMELAGHLWNVCKLGECSVTITFHEPVDITMFGDRKKLCDHCFRVISQGLQAINRGELAAQPLPKAAE